MPLIHSVVRKKVFIDNFTCYHVGMDKKYLEQRLKDLKIYDKYYYRLELKSLASYLYYDENVNCILTGVYDGMRRLVAVTDARIIIVTAGPMVKTEFLVIKRGAVKSWKFTKRFLFSSFEFRTEKSCFTFSMTQAGREKLLKWAMEQPVKCFDE